jgi:hypothetical protein
VIGVVATLVLVAATPSVAGATSGGPKVQEFASPNAIVVAHSRAWVANYANNSVTELNSSDGALVRVIRKKSYKFNYPGALAINGNDLWVANFHANSVTELSTVNGSLIRVVSDPADKINDPNDIASVGGDVWILDTGNSDITELRASDGGLVRVINGSNFGLSFPLSFAFSGTDMWVSSETQVLEEFDTKTGAHVDNRLSNIGGGSISVVADDNDIWVIGSTGVLMQFSVPNLVQLHSFYSESEEAGPISIFGGEVWVGTINEAMEYNASTGSLSRVVKIPPVGNYEVPGCIEASGSHVWICYQHWLRELNASNGSLVRVIPDK